MGRYRLKARKIISKLKLKRYLLDNITYILTLLIILILAIPLNQINKLEEYAQSVTEVLYIMWYNAFNLNILLLIIAFINNILIDDREEYITK